MKKSNYITIAILALTMIVSSVCIVFAEGSSTQSTYTSSYDVEYSTSASGKIVLQGVFTDSALTAEEAIDFSPKLTTSGTLNKTYCFSLRINSLAEGCSIKSIKADFEGTGLPNANAHNISLSQSSDDYWSCVLEGNTSGGYVSSFQINVQHICSYTKETTEPSCYEEGFVVDVCTCGHSDGKTSLGFLDHSYGEWTVVEEATCIEPGSRKKVCSVCGDIFTKAIPAQGHDYKEGYCSRCGDRVFASGTCGDNLTWVLNDEGTLTISGSGAMEDYDTASACPWYSNRSSVVKVVIDDRITHIGNRSFYSCNKLNDVKIGSDVESIGAWAFYNNASLEMLTIPASVTALEDSSFRACSNLNSIVFEGNAPTLGTYVFTDCSATIIIHCYENTTGWDADGWTSMNLSTEHMVNYEIEEPTCTEAGLKHGYCSICGVYVEEVIPSPGHDFKDGYCSKCGDRQILDTGTCGPSANFVLYGDGILEISGNGDLNSFASASWFTNRDKVKNVVISQGMTSIGGRAFNYCSNLKSVTIPEGVTSIGSYAFENCISLTSISIPESVSYISKGAFAYCSSLTNIAIPESVTSISAETFLGCNSLNKVTIPNSVTSIESNAFGGCSGLTSVTIPNSVTSIGTMVFSGCSGLTSVTIPEGVTDIADIFYGCTGLKSVTIPESVTRIDGAFYGCLSLTSITIPGSVGHIGANTFGNCSSLASITIPGSVTSIGSNAFFNCSSLKYVFFGGTQSQWDRLSNRPTNAIVHYSATDHTWNKNYTVDVKATYAKAGSKSIHCSVCNAKKPGSTASIPKLKVKATTISKVTPYSKAFTVKWKKGSGINGYQIQYATNSKFTSGKKTVKITKASTISKKITKLKASKKYYVRVRTYKTVNGKKYYSAWSKAKTVTTKK